MASREQNEKRFGQWELLPDGVRRYWTDRQSAVSGFQRIIKWVDMNERTVRLVQEIYNAEGRLIERYQKFPVDTGHEVIDEEQQ